MMRRFTSTGHGAAPCTTAAATTVSNARARPSGTSRSRMKCAGVMNSGSRGARRRAAATRARPSAGRITRRRADEERRHHEAAGPRVVRGAGEDVDVVGAPRPQRDLALLRRARPCRRRTAAVHDALGPSGRARRVEDRRREHLARLQAAIALARRDMSSTRVEVVDEQPTPASPSTMYATSSAFRCVLTSTTAACSLAAATHTSKNAIEFGSMIAMRSSAATPRAASVCASRSVRSSNSRVGARRPSMNAPVDRSRLDQRFADWTPSDHPYARPRRPLRWRHSGRVFPGPSRRGAIDGLLRADECSLVARRRRD